MSSNQSLVSIDLHRTFLDLPNSGRATPIEVTQAFWQSLATGERRIEGRLVGIVPVDAHGSHWERHPQGDEILIALSGEMSVVLEDARGETRIALPAGRAFVVPQGVWHRIATDTAGEILFLTAGEGTDHRD